jgi:hypothetical protein
VFKFLRNGKVDEWFRFLTEFFILDVVSDTCNSSYPGGGAQRTKVCGTVVRPYPKRNYKNNKKREVFKWSRACLASARP